MDRLKACVIGCGRMGAQPSERLAGIVPAGWLPISHAECIQLIPELSLAALCDADPERLKLYGERYGVSELFTDYVALLEKVRPDVVSVATRTPEKGGIIRAACANGAKAIYVEKPLANSIAETRALLGSARDAGVVLGYGVNRRYHAVYRRARELVKNGAIGDVLEISIEHGQAPLLWSHPHSVDLALFLLGSTDVKTVHAQLKPDTVSVKSERAIDSDPVIEHARFEFQSGASATIVRTGGLSVRIGGSSGIVTIHGDGSYLQLSRRSDRGSDYFLSQEFEHAPPPPSATVTALRELTAAAIGQTAPSISLAEIETGQAMLMGAVWSHLQSRRISLSEVPHDLVVTGKFRDMYA